MEVFLYNSTVCRLCGEENDNGTLLYSCEENNQSLCEIINTYLPIKVSDDGELPRTICPGCTIQLEATVEFLNLIINGQKILRELYQREKEYKKTVLNNSNKGTPEVISEKIIYEINTSNGVYQVEHPISLQVSGLDKPKRKRGRPPKKQKTAEEIAQETPKTVEIEDKTEKDDDERSGKRRRKTPTRFKEAVQGKELERIFIEEGVIDGNESDHNTKADTTQENKLPVNKEPQVIGHLEASGELVVVVKGKGRGRPKGRTRQTREECAICGLEFAATGRYMSHIAQHGPVLYKCDCGQTFTTKLLFSEHQNTSGHSGRTVVPCRNEVESQKESEKNETPLIELIPEAVEDVVKGDIQIPQALPDLSDLDPLKCDDHVKTETVKNEQEREENDPLQDECETADGTREEVQDSKKEKVKIKCNHCDKLFGTRQSKSLHIKQHRDSSRTRQTREECAICGLEFAATGRYMSHIAQHGPVLYKCDCGQTFTTKLLFSEHQNTSGHSGRTVVPCRNEVESQKESEKNETPLIELIPEAVEDVVKGDIQIPQALPDLSDLDPLKCDDHVKTETVKNEQEREENDPLQDECETADGTREEVQDSKKEKVKIKCNHCDKLFGTRQSKSLHIKAVHLGEKSYVCPECGARFAYPRSLAVHRQAHRRARPSAGYACDLCGKVLNHPSSVVYHKQAEHADQRYVCGACGKQFRHKQLLQRHQLVHSQARPFSCKVCNATFKTKANLLNHQLLHSGVKKFSCEICKHKFAHKTSLTLHMRWHTGVKPFTCGVCGKSFSQKGNLSEHERIHTGEKPYQCALCPRRFTTSSQHRLHARRHAERTHCCGKCGKRMSSRSVWAAHVRRDDCTTRRLARQKVTKQISLLVNDKNHQPVQLEDPKLSDDNTEERVIYVAYDTEDSESTAFHILDPEQVQTADIEQNKVLTTCELYTRPSLLVSQQLQQLQLETAEQQVVEHEQLEIDEHLELEHEELGLDDEQIKIENQMEIEEIEEIETSPVVVGGQSIPVTDERGNPLHFTMADGTKLAITSVDGKSLQVITQDGQTIPVEINGYDNQDQVPPSPNAVVHQLHLQKTPPPAPVTHYFTIV
ncbi:putative zinc finger protein 585A [Danaus plexippus plexippus]|uniref:Zinc finger protein 585A n=1 Tax=Danaus plexippus plexippus TaxID=278856 RepID=A0A212EJC9_DANPL|nr:putative zinc finger protein 585A [Danaus plexippus plexippus]